MKNLSRIVRLGLLVPVAFITLAAALVTVVIAYRSWQLESATREAQKLAIESHVLSESAKIAEEVYLKLDNWEARERQVETYFQGGGAKTVLRFEPPQANGKEGSKKQKMHWESTHPNEEHLLVPLYFSDIFVGTMFVDVSWGSAWSFGGLKNLVATLVLPVLTVIGLWFFTALVLRKKVFVPLLEKMVQLNRLEAISETTQMIAHDVRKPFHAVRLSLRALNQATGADEARRIIAKVTPTVDKAISEVEHMLRDIADLERPNDCQAKETSLSKLVKALVSDFAEQQRASGAVLNVTLGHSHLASIDDFKIQRVLSNLFQNAFQAVEHGGRVWIKTEERSRRNTRQEIVVCVGNTGSVIKPEDKSKLFDRFFTKGKKNGTGLGLAIAKRFVEDHGGKIWCQSDVDRGTRFYLSIPASSGHEDQAHKELCAGAIPDESILTPAVEGHPQINPSGQRANGPYAMQGTLVTIISDDNFFRDGLCSLLDSISHAGRYRRHAFSMTEALLAERELARSHVVIIDVEDERYLAPLRATLERLSASARICIYSRTEWAELSFDCVRTPRPLDAPQLEEFLGRTN